MLALVGWGWTIAVFVAPFLLQRFLVWRGARRIRRIHTTIYEGGLVPTSPADHPDLDHAFYDATEAAFAHEGFTKVADLELLSATRTHPDMRTFIRAMVDGAGVVSAAIYHVKVRGRCTS